MTQPPLMIEYVEIGSLQPDPDNPRSMSPMMRAALDRSLTEFGLVEPLIVRRRDRRVVGGHQRLAAAKAQGLTQVPVVFWDGDDVAWKALNLALNQIQGDFVAPGLAARLAELAQISSLHEALRGFDPTWTAPAGFSPREVLAALEHLTTAEPATEDLSALPPGEPSAAEDLAPGMGFQCGPHFVVCGDARDESLLGQIVSEPPTLCVTDPPYNVHYSDGVGGRAGSGRPPSRQRPLGPIANDDLPPAEYDALLRDALRAVSAVLAPGAAVYLCGGSSTTSSYDAAFAAANLHKAGIIIWDKTHFTFGRRDYQSQVEFLHYGWTPGRHHFYGGRQQSDLWSIPREPTVSYKHPNQKPVALVERAILNSSRAGEWVIDPFAGSGTTVIAAERTGRRAICLDIDPHYVITAVRRWEAYAGEPATPWTYAGAPEAADA